jgi:hypothetical protein
MAANAEFLTALGSGWDTDTDFAVEGGHGDAGAKHRFPRSDLNLVEEIMILDVKVRVLSQADAQIKVSGGAATSSGLPSSGHAQSLAFGDAGRDLDLVGSGRGLLSGAAARRADAAAALAGARALLAR